MFRFVGVVAGLGVFSLPCLDSNSRSTTKPGSVCLPPSLELGAGAVSAVESGAGLVVGVDASSSRVGVVHA